MFSPAQYLLFATEADASAEASSDPEWKAHFVYMAESWRRLEAFTAATEACRPGGPDLH